MEMTDHTTNVSVPVNQGLCTSCGACQFVCSEGAIHIGETVGGHLLPVIDAGRCTGCGACLSLCPGAGLIPDVLDALPLDPFVGHARASYAGRAADEDLFRGSQSGGMVSALLCWALEKGLVAGAVTTVMAAGNPPRPEASFAKSRSDVMGSQKSKYCPVPLLAILDEVQQSEGPVAFVGTSCHVHALRNLQSGMPWLRDKIAIVIGLFCDRTMTLAAIDYLITQSGFRGRGEAALYFRDKSVGGYPGRVHVQGGGKSVTLPPEARMRIKDDFTPARCRICFDKLNVLADISMGDPWGIEGANKQGESVAVVRTPTGEDFFARALGSGLIRAREIPHRDIVTGQGIAVKRCEWAGYMEAWQSAGRETPNFREKVLPLAGPPGEGQYAAVLARAWSLDSFRSRKDLVDRVRRKMRLSDAVQVTLKPVRWAKRSFHRLRDGGLRRMRGKGHVSSPMGRVLE